MIPDLETASRAAMVLLLDIADYPSGEKPDVIPGEVRFYARRRAAALEAALAVKGTVKAGSNSDDPAAIRRAALEEAAAVAFSFGSVEMLAVHKPYSIAAAIRALADKGRPMTDLETAACAALEAMKAIRDQDIVELNLDPDWPRRMAAPHIAALEAALAASDNRVRESVEDILYHVDGGRAAIRRAALEEAARVIDCGCANADAVTKVPPNSGERWRLCGEGTCGAIEAAAIRALADKEPSDE